MYHDIDLFNEDRPSMSMVNSKTDLANLMLTHGNINRTNLVVKAFQLLPNELQQTIVA